MSTRLSVARIRDEQWVARYVSGRLTEAENEVFEDYCVAHPALVDEVELERRMKAALAETASKSPGRFGIPVQRRWLLPATAAATVLATVGLLLLFQRYFQPVASSPLAALASEGNGASSLIRVSLAQTRGGESTLGSASQAVMQMTLLGVYEIGRTYDLSLVDADGGKVIALLDGQSPASTQELRFLMDGTGVAPGAYTLRVVDPTTGNVQEFDFRKD